MMGSAMAKPRSKSRTWSRRLLLGFASLLFAIGLAELAVRLLFSGDEIGLRLDPRVAARRRGGALRVR